MTVKLSELMTKDVATCRLDSTLEAAANQFWSNDVGVLPVVDARGRVVGMLTDRDVCLSSFFRGRLLKEIAVGEAMSTTVASCRSTDSLDSALAKMSEARVRRLPVVDADGALEGMVGLTDVVDAIANRKLTLTSAKALLATLSAIGTPHGVETNRAKPVELTPKAKTAKPATAKKPAKAAVKAPKAAKPTTRSKNDKSSRKA